MGESQPFSGALKLMEAHGVEVIDLNSPECINMMKNFIREKPHLWHEAIMALN